RIGPAVPEENCAHSVFLARRNQALLVEGMSVGFWRGEKARSHRHPIRPEREGSDKAASIGDPAGCENDRGRNRIDHARDQHNCRDRTGTVAASLYPLRYDDVRSRASGPNGIVHRTHLHDDGNPSLTRGLDEWRRVTPEQRQRPDPLLNADADSVLVRKVQNEVHAEWTARQRAQALDFVPQTRRWAKLRLEDAEAAGVANRCDQLHARQVGSHRGNHDRRLDAEMVAEAGSKHSSNLPATSVRTVRLLNGIRPARNRRDPGA